ncbi:MAG TPA: efflux RND transporter periplasmic adaptor subunit [Flavobacteriaceae bacterium]|nr:efflux RND transporter periplasmic adaptor subunit [Flavobacteriaceae bacterium]
MKKGVIRWIVVILILLVVVLVYGKKSGWFGTDLEQVEIATVETTSIDQLVSATGKIYPETEIKLSSEVSGEIIELPVREGQQVSKGDLLVRLNPDLIQSSLSQSQAAMQNAQAQHTQAKANEMKAEIAFNRNKSLFEKGVISASEWEAIETEYKVAKASVSSAYYNVQSALANVKQAQDNLARTTIYSPMDGTVSMLSSELGERVVGTAQMTGTEILRIANLLRMEVEVEVNENDIVKVSLGDKTKINVDAYPRRQFTGEVTEIANSADADLKADQVTNFKVKIKILPESYEDLLEGQPENFSPFRPGMTATVDIVTMQVPSALAVPIGAIVMKGKDDFKEEEPKFEEDTDKVESVFVFQNNKVVLRQVETGIQDSKNIEIKKGLQEGDKIVVGPYATVTRTLRDGQEVENKEAL